MASLCPGNAKICYNSTAMNLRKKIAIFILFVCLILMFVGCWAFLTVNVPYWDDYGALIKYLSEPWPGRWTHLFDFHNEHRIATARLVADFVCALGGGTFNFRGMMAVGNLIQLAYAVAWVMLFRKCRLGMVAALPVFWLMTSFIHYENTCWALCSVQNIVVVALTFYSCLLFARRRQCVFAFAGSLVCGIGATFSSGGGLLVWPSLLMMELAEPLSSAGDWKIGMRNITCHVKASAGRILVFLTVATVATICYLHDFPGSTTEQPAGLAMRIANGTLFFVAFLGGMVPLYPIAIAIGLVLLPFIVFITARYPRIRHPAVFWFMVAELATMLSAAVFRSADPHAAVSSRYCIVPCSVFAALLFLCIEQIQLPERILKRLLVAMTAGIMLYTTAFLVLGAQHFARRNELMRRNILTWPTYLEGLRSGSPKIDGDYLRKCVERGVYNPASVLMPGEAPPKIPAPWLR